MRSPPATVLFLVSFAKGEFVTAVTGSNVSPVSLAIAIARCTPLLALLDRNSPVRIASNEGSIGVEGDVGGWKPASANRGDIGSNRKGFGETRGGGNPVDATSSSWEDSLLA